MHCCPNCGTNLSAFSPLEFGNIVIGEDGLVSLDGYSVHLTPTLYKVAECIIRARGRGVTRDILAARLDREVFDDSIKKYIERLRGSFKAIDPTFDQIRSIHGFGAYCWRFKHGQAGSSSGQNSGVQYLKN